MEALHFVIIALVGILSGALNTVAGGGSLISLPVLIFMHLPPAVANATNRVAILSQNIFAVRGFHTKGQRLPFPYVVYLSIASIFGGFLGARLAIDIDDQLFKRLLAIVMIVVVVIIAAGGKKTAEGQPEHLGTVRQVIGTVAFFLVGFYGGFIQAGVGFLVLAILSQVNRFSLVKSNYIKVFSALLYTIVSVTVFAIAGKIEWVTGLVLATGQGVGGWYASRWSVDKGDVWIRRVLVVAVIGLSLKLWFFE